MADKKNHLNVNVKEVVDRQRKEKPKEMKKCLLDYVFLFDNIKNSCYYNVNNNNELILL